MGSHDVPLNNTQTIKFMWPPSHIDVTSNSADDTAAEATVLMPISNLTVSHSDYLSLIRTHVLNQWQSSWSLETENKLHAIEPAVNEHNQIISVTTS